MQFRSPITDAMAKHRVPFVIVGGHAVFYHGHRRSTEDIDIVWLRSPESEVALANALEAIGAHYIGDDIDPTTGIERLHPTSLPFVQRSHLMMLLADRIFFDLFDYVPGHPTEPTHHLYDTSIEVDGTRFASLDWLRRMKQAAGRPKDLLDLHELDELAKLRSETLPGTAE